MRKSREITNGSLLIILTITSLFLLIPSANGDLTIDLSGKPAGGQQTQAFKGEALFEIDIRDWVTPYCIYYLYIEILHYLGEISQKLIRCK